MQGESRQPGRSTYLDFELEIGAGRGREYPVAVLDSPAGEARATMRFPFDELALENRLLNLQNALLRSGGEPRRTLSAEEQAVQEFGQALFEALFPPELRSCYDVSLREAEQQGVGLRLKLRIQPPELAALPWEFLYHPGQAEYVSLSTQTPVVRYLEVPQRIQPLTVQPPLRILGLIASPYDLPGLDVACERQRIESAVGDLRARGLVELAWLPGQTWHDLQRTMRQGPWHIFHFIGHGGFDRRTGEGLIVLADSEGQAAHFGATRLGRLLADHASLRLVLLNACEGARGGEHDIFSSTAAILVRRGIPAVLAMQYPITDRAAIEFARTFYEALGDGMPVDGAVAEARKAISFAVANTVEWGTPVLYMRSPDGVLFQVSGPPPEKRPPSRAPAPAEAQAEQEQRLEPLYVDGLGAFWVEDWERACRCFQALVDERPDYRDANARLQEAERQRALAGLYAQAQAARAAGDWPGACSALEDLVAREPGYKDAAALLETAKVQAQLADLYAQARQLHRAGRWQAAVNVFERIAALDPDYPDPEGLLSSAQEEVAAQARRAELQALYRRAVLAVDSGQWAAARELLARVQAQEPGYREAARLLARAESELVHQEVEQQRAEAEQRRQEQIATLYRQALDLLHAKNWQAALARMAEIRTLDAEFGDPEGVAARAAEALAQEEEEKRRRQAESQRRETEQRRQEQVASLYEQARQQARAGQWQQVLAKVEEIKSLDPEFFDLDGLAARAQAGLEREEKEARQQKELAALYAEAVRLLRTEQYEEALQAWDQVRARDPHYPDREKVEATARKKLAARAEPTGRRRLPPWVWAAIAGLGLVAAVAVTVFVIVPAITPTPQITPVPTSGSPQPGPTPATLTAGSEWAWSDGSVMVYVPAGAFRMGSYESDPDTNTDEKPPQQVTLDAFWIDRTEVTNGQYRRCVDDGACHRSVPPVSPSRDSYYGNPDFDDYPVIYVHWTQANAYCAWAGKRLPTEAEWEKAARGTDKRTYPWGEEISCTRANYSGNNGACVGDTTQVGSYPLGSSPYGALDMAGNVLEWTSSLYEPYPYDAQDGREDPVVARGSRVVRGGSWYSDQRAVRAASRSSYDGLSPGSYPLGFRCARSGSESAPAETPMPTITRTSTPTIPAVPPSGPPQPGPTPAALTISSEWAWSDGSVMVYVPAGVFRMGSSNREIEAILAECSGCDQGWFTDESPQQVVILAAFWIDRTEVTNGQYRRCVDDGACRQPAETRSSTRDSYYDNPDFDDYPVIYVDWEQANAYCAWAGKRLPSEAEWEKAARSADKRIYPWGEGIDCSRANYGGCVGDTARVGSYPSGASPYGALDMAGNVWEWPSTLYAPYPYDAQDGREDPATYGQRVVRGGSWYDIGEGYVRAASRSHGEPSLANDRVGFRCARSGSEP